MALSNHDVIVQAIELIESRIGIAVGKQFNRELPDLFNRLAHGDPETYLQQLQQSTDQSAEWQRLINTLTIGETYFFREEGQFDALRKHILPKLILNRRQRREHTLRIWSAGCASGEEPYSIAIVLHQFLPDINKWNIEIHATDVNEYSLSTARHGVYRQWAFRHTDMLFQQNYFDKVDGGFQIKPFIKNMVTFRQHNLLQAKSTGNYDVIFCKNVLLYFDEPYVAQIENRLFQVLNPQGWLFLGQAEALRFYRDRWQTHLFPGSPIYQRPDDGTHPIDIEYRTVGRNVGEHIHPVISNVFNQDYYIEAVQAIHNDNNAEAEHCLSLALANSHQLTQSHTLLASIFANRKAFPEAEAHLAATIALDPLFADAHYVSALVSLEQGRVDDAIRALQMTLYCDKSHVLAAFMLGNLYAQSGDLPKAYSQWSKVHRIIEKSDPLEFVSDISDLTVGQLEAMITTHLSDT